MIKHKALKRNFVFLNNTNQMQSVDFSVLTDVMCLSYTAFGLGIFKKQIQWSRRLI